VSPLVLMAVRSQSAHPMPHKSVSEAVREREMFSGFRFMMPKSCKTIDGPPRRLIAYPRPMSSSLGLLSLGSITWAQIGRLCRCSTPSISIL
jgi:hypothetical protein